MEQLEDDIGSGELEIFQTRFYKQTVEGKWTPAV